MMANDKLQQHHSATMATTMTMVFNDGDKARQQQQQQQGPSQCPSQCSS